MNYALGQERMTEAGEQLAVAKLEQLQAHGAPEDLGKDELYDLAQAKGVEGRSDMNKDDVINALQA